MDKKNNMRVNDIVYLYESKTTKAIIAKFIVIDNNIVEKTRFKDEQFWKNEVSFNSKGYFRMQLLEFLEEPLSITWLKENGHKSSIQTSERISLELLQKIRLKELKKRIVDFPDLANSSRDYEFNQYTRKSISRVIKSYLFKGYSHRKIDEEVLLLDSSQTKGFQSMGILHYLGLIDKHKGIFKGLNSEEAEVILNSVKAWQLLNYFKYNNFGKTRNESALKEEIETVVKAKEGRKIQIYTYKYERKTELRNEAIKIHGLTCKACGFNFEDYYGEVGKDFIEIHHIKPLHSYDEEIDIIPEYDLVPVCSNCHRMIHRKKDNILSIDQLKSILNSR